MKLFNKEKGYHDFAVKSRYFSTGDENPDALIDELENQKRYLFWVQEFSKKIVSITFIIYIFVVIYSIILIYLSYRADALVGLDTLISELNMTFREVIGGYIIKSAVENSVKIAGNYFVGITDAKLNAIREKMEFENKDNCNNTSENYEEDDYSDLTGG